MKNSTVPPGAGVSPSGAITSGSLASSALTIVVLAATALVVILLTLHPVVDPDTWFHLRLGRFILDTGTLPRTDPFSYTAGKTPYVASGWLTAVLMAWLDNIYPESTLGPILMVTMAIALAAALVLWRGRRSGTLLVTCLVLLAGLGLAVTRFSPRPDVWSMPGLTALLLILSRSWAEESRFTVSRLSDAAKAKRGPGHTGNRSWFQVPHARLLWLLPVLMIVWANLHAGVLIALPFLVSYGAWLLLGWWRHREGAWLQALLPVAIACGAWVANPYGTGLIGLANRIAQMPGVGWVMEWMPFYKQNFPLPWTTNLFFIILAVITAWLLVTRRRDFHPLEILWLVALFVLTLVQRRQVGLLGLACPLLLARHLHPAEAWAAVKFHSRRIAAAVVIAAAILLSALQVSGANSNGGGWPRYGRNCTALPCYTAEFLKGAPPPGHIFNSYNLGGYLLNMLWPETQVYIDGRLDTYPEAVWLDMLALEENRLPIDEFTARYQVKTFVVVIKDSIGDPLHLASRLAARKDYALVHLDDKAAVFVHKDADTVEYGKKHALLALSPWDLKRMTQIMATPEGQASAIDQIGRLIQQSPASASVHSLAGFVAYAAGDEIMAEQQLAQAAALQPDNLLLKQVNNRITAARARLTR